MEFAQSSRIETDFAAAPSSTPWTDHPVASAETAVPLAGLALCQWPEMADTATDPALPDPALPDPALPDTVVGDRHVRLRVVVGRIRPDTVSPRPASAGQIVVLDEPATAPVEVFQGSRLLARGQLRSLDGRYCVQITELVRAPESTHSTSDTSAQIGTRP